MKTKILLVGEREALEPIAKVLKKDRYAVSMAHSLDDALMMVKDFGPHVVIHGVNLPRQECLKLCERLRKDAVEIPVIMVTEEGISKSDIIQCLKKGCSDVLLMPFNKVEIYSKIENQIKIKLLYDEIKQDKKDITAMLDLTRALSSTLDSKEILYLIVKKISDVIDVKRCSIVRIDPNSRYGFVVASHEHPTIRDIKIDLRKYPEIKKALLTKDMVLIANVSKDPLMGKVRRYLEKIEFDSIMVVPILYREEVIGILILRTSRMGGTFTEKEMRFCKVVANAAASALYNAYLYEMIEEDKTRLQRLAITDDLTGLYNHRYFTHRLKDEFNRAIRYNHPLSFIMLDIDYFKVINDTYGHRRGDIILREFAQVLKRNIRKTDILSRYGGEEFVIILPQTNQNGALKEGERIRKILREYDYRIKDMRLTVSLGVATYPHPHIKTQDDLLGCADKALFIAKGRGRDSTAVYT